MRRARNRARGYLPGPWREIPRGVALAPSVPERGLRIAARSRQYSKSCIPNLRRHPQQIERISSALSQEFPERHHFWRGSELVCNKIVFIKNSDRLSILHYRRNVRVEMHDQTALQILGANFCGTRGGRTRHQIEIIAQSLRV